MAKHLTPTPHGTQARLRIKGTLHTRHFPAGTPAYSIQRWLLTTKLRFGAGATAPTSGRFVDDARAYLAAVAAMPTFVTRTQHIEEWIEVFGTRQRETITPTEIAQVLQVWRTTPRQSPHGRHHTRTVTLSASACNHRRTALMHLWTTLDGKHAPNPVRAVPKFRAPATQPRALSREAVTAILATMRPNVSRARLLVMAATGLPQAQIMAITPADVNLKARTVALQGRRKGAGTQGSVRPLSREGVAAFAQFAKVKAWGPFSASSLRTRFRAACVRAGVPPVTPYVLRHAYITEVLKLTGDLHATQQLAGHKDARQTQRYAMSATDARVQAAIRVLDGRKSATSAKRSAKTRTKPNKTAS